MLEFAGALVLVTHDRYLLDRVSRRSAGPRRQGRRPFLRRPLAMGGLAGAPAGELPAAGRPPRRRAGKALSGKELKEFKTMEARIHEAEARAEAAKLALEDPAVATDAAELLKRHEALDAARAKISALFARWEELDAKRR